MAKQQTEPAEFLFSPLGDPWFFADESGEPHLHQGCGPGPFHAQGASAGLWLTSCI